VRPATVADAELIARFNLALARETEGIVLDPVVVARGVQAVFDDPARGEYFIAELDGRPVGQAQITLEWSDWRNGWFWWIQSVYVEAGARRRGVFRALYEHIASLARSRGDVRGLRLYVVDSNAPAVETYTRLGMSRTQYLFYETDCS
jgi:GNAT superfamily N-acetyltransferase